MIATGIKHTDLIMGWSTASLAGKTADVFVPESQPARHGALFLHGYDEVTLRDNLIYTAEFERQGLKVVCPQGGKCWWCDVVANDFDPAITPVEFLARHLPSLFTDVPGALGVFGVEMGGQGALQLAYRHARQFPVVVAISPKIDFDEWYGEGTSLDRIFSDREAARQATAILHIHPLDWPRYQQLLCDPADAYCRDGALTLASKLSSSGIPFDEDFSTSHGGYGWGYANAMAGNVVTYLAEKLAAHARRVDG